MEYPSVPAWKLVEQMLPRWAHRLAVRELDQDTLEEGRVLTYESLFRAARGAAGALRGRRVEPGARVGILLHNSADLIVAFNAAWYAGAAAVPVNPGASVDEVATQFRDADVALVIGDAAGPGRPVAAQLGVEFVDGEGFAAMQTAEALVQPPPTSADDLAVIMYTGGTTGVSKGVALTHRTIVLNTQQFREWYAFVPGDEVAIATIPMFHGGGMTGVMNVPLSAGATVLVFRRFRAAGVAAALGRYGATRLFAVPTVFSALLNDEVGLKTDYSTLRPCRTNATSLPVAVKERFDSLVGRPVLVEGYGLTEMTTITHANPIARAKAGSIGIPLPDTEARIVDPDTGLDVATGVSGELIVRGPQMMRGYLNRPRETAEAMLGGWLRTGDMAVADDDGYVSIVGRRKDVINTAGFKVWPREVEEALGQHPAVKMAMVVGISDEYRGEIVKALVVLRDDDRAGTTAADLTAFCRERLTGFKVPREIEIRDALPMSDVGKMLRRVAREQR
jgi:long-chain acyl-CoA synthetase